MKLQKYIGILMLLFAIGFNLWIYRLEPTATSDPNDNTFQYALVDRTNQMWDFAVKKCSSNYLTFGFCHLSFLVDHWVPNWAQGYNLPSYYSHIPQIVIVASWRFFSHIPYTMTHFPDLFQYYHWIIYLLLSFFPLSLFLALRIIGVSWLTAGFGALIASQLSTDGLYGLDPASFLWRGWGLSSQLFSMIWFPLSIAFTYRLFNQPNQSDTTSGTKFSKDASELRFQENFRHAGRYLWPIFFLSATTAGHLGIGVIAFLSVGIMFISTLSHLSDLGDLKQKFRKLFLLYGGVLLLLGYWIIPILIDGNYHNISAWDGIWKFDSFGYQVVLKNLFNGDLFDFGRLPILTALVFVGLFSSLNNIGAKARGGIPHKDETTGDKIFAGWKRIAVPRKFLSPGAISPDLSAFGLLFIFWLLLYFGRTTWGGLFALIPGMSEFHLSRFIVGVHLAGLFLIPIGFQAFVDLLWRGGAKFSKDGSELRFRENFVYAVSHIIIGILLFIIISPQTLRYAAHNDFLITRANEIYTQDAADIDLLLSTVNRELSTNPGRVFAGRGGSWGRNFRIAETPIYMYLSTYGVPTILWLPETWSPNSDTEQYFSENNPAHYSLYNVRYVVTPIDLAKDQIQPFWKPLKETSSWKLYEVSFRVPSVVEGSSQNMNFGYITSGVRPAIVSTSKTDYRSLVRLWMHSDDPKQGLYPELTFDTNYPKNFGLPNFRMLDEVTYKVPAGTTHNLFSEVPRYQSPITNHQSPIVTSQSQKSDMVFSASVEVPPACTECLVILRQSFHPSWRATIDGKPARTMTVFPFYIGVSVSEGKHEVIFSYQPSGLKIFLLLISLITLISLIFPSLLHIRHTLMPAMRTKEVTPTTSSRH